MKKFLVFIAMIMNVGILFSFSACQRPHVGQYEFNYYPERNIYYSIETSKFHYSLDGGKTWEDLKTDFTVDSTLLGKSEKIYSKTPEVWKENRAHLEMYEGKLVTIVDEKDRSFAVASEEVTDKKIIVTGGGPAKQSAAPAKKKGIKGFFNRIFGKKEKK